jgi:hypothetical protein
MTPAVRRQACISLSPFPNRRSERRTLSRSEAAFGFGIAHLAGRRHIPAMCNDFGNRIAYDDYLRAFNEIKAPLRWPPTAPNLEPRDDIWPTEPAPAIRRREDGVELGVAALGLSSGPAQGSACHQLSVGRPVVPERSLSGPGIALFRVRRQQVTKIKVAVH